ncbi:acyl carrier protein [Flavisolibacter nicotianae]|uniref:acyl carrier protein n=1 Tax=Flavisolibacter nicotianae TaxID=2364882 RepID=UPI000EB37CDC|nr:phosphopantetheine-binding protein [Flavisolibacter nicotianae]
MTEEELKPVIFRLLKGVAPDTEPETLKPDDNIRTTLEIDSFDYLQFIVALDEQFGMDTPEEDYGKIQTLHTLLAYLFQKAKKTV